LKPISQEGREEKEELMVTWWKNINRLRENHSKNLKWQIMAEGIGGSDGETLASYPSELQETKFFAGVKMRPTDWKLRSCPGD
jgi:hypothetical protein